MIRVTVTYAVGSGGRFDLAYYTESHARLVRDIYEPIGLTRFEVDHDVEKNIVAGQLVFARSATLKEDLARVSGPLVADAANYTDVAPSVAFALVVLHAH